jgi:hypothetical protein
MSTYLCVGYEAYVREIDEPLTAKFWQYLTLYVKSTANTQVTYDFGSYVAGSLGTFWSAAVADTTVLNAPAPAQGLAPPVFAAPAPPGTTTITAGAVATQAIALLAQINVLQESLLSFQSPLLIPKVQVLTSAATNSYVVTVANNCPSLVLNSGEAPTTTTAFVITWDLAPGNHGVKSPLTYF